MLPGRNDPCPCGSGKKFKKCCGGQAGATVADASAILTAARKACGSGDYRQAFALALSVAASTPNNIEALRICGLGALSLGRWDQAQEFLQRGVKLVPDDASFRSNLALALIRSGRAVDAERECREALRLNPGLADGHNTLAQALVALGRQEEAVAAYRHAIANDPASAVFRFNLGALLQSAGQLHEAQQYFGEALALSPRFAPALGNLGVIHLQSGRTEQATECLLNAHDADPRNVEILNNLGIAMLRSGKYAEAVMWLRRSIETGDYGPAYANLAVALEKSGDVGGAIDAYRSALERRPDDRAVFRNLLTVLANSGDLDGAQALLEGMKGNWDKFDPALLPCIVEVCQKTVDLDRLDKVRSSFLAALEAGALGNEDHAASLALLNYDDSIPEESIFRLHRAWGSGVARGAARASVENRTGTSAGRIRLGYVSPDFRRHSVGHFVRNLIACHDRSRVEVYCYANARATDVFTDAIRSSAHSFQCVVDLSDLELAERIRADGIDILIDLAGHTRGGRLEVLAQRPASVQVAYLGYPQTTGADFIDYWITDVHAHDENDSYHTERLLRLPESFLCFGEFDPRPTVPTPPVLRNGYVTFGSFNNLAKLSRTTLTLWAQILRRVAGSKLMIKGRGADSRAVRTHLLAQFARHDLTEDRLVLIGHVSGPGDHLDYYNDVDVALDPIPYNGTTTTCEALWMGVPVVTLVGKTHRQRTSYSILKNAGLEETICRTEDEYVSTAARLSGDPAALAELRCQVTSRIRRSVLCDPARFTRQFEDVLLAAAGRRYRESRLV
jgi:predicted O-linked N-acetylglucosamine transferase (SPINDLY family)